MRGEGKWREGQKWVRARGAGGETETGHRSTENGDLVREQQAAPDYFWF